LNKSPHNLRCFGVAPKAVIRSKIGNFDLSPGVAVTSQSHNLKSVNERFSNRDENMTEKKKKVENAAEKTGEAVGKGIKKGAKAVEDLGKGIKKGLKKEE
jgi:hypothetical protein